MRCSVLTVLSLALLSAMLSAQPAGYAPRGVRAYLVNYSAVHGDRFLEENNDTSASAFGKNFSQFRISNGKSVPGENDTVLEGDGNLEIVAGHRRTANLCT